MLTNDQNPRAGEERPPGLSQPVDIAIRGPALSTQSAPAEIDYLSIEHNFTPARERIRALLERQGYVRKREHLSRLDD